VGYLILPPYLHSKDGCTAESAPTMQTRQEKRGAAKLGTLSQGKGGGAPRPTRNTRWNMKGQEKIVLAGRSFSFFFRKKDRSYRGRGSEDPDYRLDRFVEGKRSNSWEKRGSRRRNNPKRASSWLTRRSWGGKKITDAEGWKKKRSKAWN